MTIDILMPALSPTMTDGTLAKWLKKEGDKIEPGDVIAEIETDKATMEVESADEGILGKIFVNDNTEGVLVNRVIAVLLEDGENKDVLKSYKLAEPEQAKPEKPSAPVQVVPAQVVPAQAVPAQAAPVISTASAKSNVKASPLAKRLAAKSSIDLSSVRGTGPKGRIIKADIEDALSGGGGGIHRNNVEFISIPNTGMRKVIAKRLLEAKQQIPHFYLTVDCELDSLLTARKQLNTDGEPNYKLSVNDFIIKATGLALKKVPEANASWYDDAIVQYNNVDVSVAVAIDGGLITPIVKNADQKTLPQISNEVKKLASRAKSGELAPEEYQGGGFTISNLGMFGIKSFSAIVNPPQACILAVGKGEDRAVVKNGEIKISTVMTVTLSVDHRAVDGAIGAAFLDAFKKYIEQPITMFV